MKIVILSLFTLRHFVYFMLIILIVWCFKILLFYEYIYFATKLYREVHKVSSSEKSRILKSTLTFLYFFSVQTLSFLAFCHAMIDYDWLRRDRNEQSKKKKTVKRLSREKREIFDEKMVTVQSLLNYATLPNTRCN